MACGDLYVDPVIARIRVARIGWRPEDDRFAALHRFLGRVPAPVKQSPVDATPLEHLFYIDEIRFDDAIVSTVTAQFVRLWMEQNKSKSCMFNDLDQGDQLQEEWGRDRAIQYMAVSAAGWAVSCRLERTRTR